MFKRSRNLSGPPAGFSLVEMLVVLATIVILAFLAIPALARAKGKLRDIQCLANLKQWGVALQLYTAEHDDYLPEEGSPTPGRGPLRIGWYVALPRVMGLPPYDEMPWRTAAHVRLPRSVFLCPANSRRATNNNLFHYCLNGNIDGTGARDRPIKISSLPWPARTVYLFDNGRRAAVAQQNNVHTNLHAQGAQFLFVDSHTERLRNTEYWDFSRNRGRINNPQLLWSP